MAKTNPLPETIYVVREVDDDMSYLVAQEDAADLVNGEDDPLVRVGTYQLTGIRKLRKSVVIVDEEE